MKERPFTSPNHYTYNCACDKNVFAYVYPHRYVLHIIRNMYIQRDSSQNHEPGDHRLQGILEINYAIQGTLFSRWYTCP